MFSPVFEYWAYLHRYNWHLNLSFGEGNYFSCLPFVSFWLACSKSPLAHLQTTRIEAFSSIIFIFLKINLEFHFKKNFSNYHIVGSIRVISQTAVHFHPFDWTATQSIVRTLLKTSLKSQSDLLLSVHNIYSFNSYCDCRVEPLLLGTNFERKSNLLRYKCLVHTRWDSLCVRIFSIYKRDNIPTLY